MTGNRYRLREGVRVLANDDDILLRAGMLHRKEITIDKPGSEPEFVAVLDRLARGEEAVVNDPGLVDDLEQLVTLGFLRAVQPVPLSTVVIVAPSSMTAQTAPLGETAFSLESLLSALVVDEVLLGRRLVTPADLGLPTDPGQQIVLISSLLHLNRLRALNRVLRGAGVPFIAALVDVDNVYLAGIRPRSSGCLECIETKVMTHFEGMAHDYLSEDIPEVVEALDAELYLVLALVRSEVASIRRFGSSGTDGTLLHIYTPTWEFSRSLNLRTALCPACAGFNRVDFEERNLRATTLLARSVQ